jgi:signal transduction histidine kinase
MLVNRQQAARFDAASLAARFPTEGLPGELAPISARLNELLARLEDPFERERRFSSDAAHEFRTPVAELRSLAELAIKLPDARAANADHETLAIALHLEAMLTHLLALARGDRDGLSAQRDRVALRPLMQEVCEQFKAKAAARQLTLVCRGPSLAAAHTDPTLLRSILTNLVDNAVAYAPPGGSVEVEARADDTGFTLRVMNTVENLEELDLSHLFERFWRKDEARSPDGHTGLGLSVARVFAQAIGCELNASFVESARLALTLARIEPETNPEEDSQQ